MSGCESAYRLLGASRSSLDWRFLSYQRSYGFTVWPLRRSIGQRHLELPVTKCNVALINVAAYESIVGGLRDTASKESSGYCGYSWYEMKRSLGIWHNWWKLLSYWIPLVFYEELGSGRRNYKFFEWINSLLFVAFIINPFERSVNKLDDIVILKISERRRKINFYCFVTGRSCDFVNSFFFFFLAFKINFFVKILSD